MTRLFSALTALALLLTALFAHLSGLVATSYFVLMFAFSGYLVWTNRLQRHAITCQDKEPNA